MTQRRLHGEDGATMVEYALLVALIAVRLHRRDRSPRQRGGAKVQHGWQQHRIGQLMRTKYPRREVQMRAKRVKRFQGDDGATMVEYASWSA